MKMWGGGKERTKENDIKEEMGNDGEIEIILV